MCTQCGEPAYKYLEMDTPSTHSWYCEIHYDLRVAEPDEEFEHIIRGESIKDNVFTTTDEFIPETDEVGLISDKYGLER